MCNPNSNINSHSLGFILFSSFLVNLSLFLEIDLEHKFWLKLLCQILRYGII